MKARPIKVRRAWAINPATRVRRSKKVYSRKSSKQEIEKLIDEEK